MYFCPGKRERMLPSGSGKEIIMSLNEEILKLADEYEDYIIACRRKVHTFAEVAMHENKTHQMILEEAEKEECLLCIIDEVLRGTNTIERIGASSRILADLERDHVLPFAATHDIELSYILEDLYENYHFEEEVKEHEVVFNYLLKKGRVTTRNAIRLLEMTGYKTSLSEGARKAVKDFEETGIWKKIGEIWKPM